MCGLELILFFIAGWWLMKEHMKHQDLQKQLLERLPTPAEESSPANVTDEADRAQADWINWFTEYFRNRAGRRPTNQECWLAQWITWARTSGEEVSQNHILAVWPWEREQIWEVLRTLRTVGYQVDVPNE